MQMTSFSSVVILFFVVIFAVSSIVVTASSSSSFLSKKKTLAATTRAGQPQLARLYLSYCPTYFTSEIAVVDVNTQDGSFKIVGKVKPPSSIVFGCSALDSPTFSFDPKTGDIIFDFTSDLGAFLKISVDDATGKVTLTHFVSPSEFFMGFESFRSFTATNRLVGIAGTVTQSGFCSDACMGFAVLDLDSGDKAKTVPLPFKAVSDDTAFLDEKNGIYYCQLSHSIPGTKFADCAPQAWQDCMVAINVTNGEIFNNAPFDRNEHVYRFGLSAVPSKKSNQKNKKSDGNNLKTSSRLQQFFKSSSAAAALDVQAFVIGDNHRCNRTDQQTSYAFNVVDLRTNNFKVTSCASNNVTIQTDEWISSFLTDPQVPLFVTSSGNSDGDNSQFLVYDVASGEAILNTQLKGLGKALGAKMGLIYIWGVGGKKQVN